MNYSFVTFLGTDSFLPGVLALNTSLKNYNKTYGMVVLVTDLITPTSILALESNCIKHKYVDRIKNPNKLENDERNFKHMYTKLRIFELDEFDKIVYLDADMLVCRNIEEIFDAPHMSAVAAGALAPGYTHWKELNAGFLVVVPDKSLAAKMYALVESTSSYDGSDQGFLQSFYNNWANDKALQLDHKYNLPVSNIEVLVDLNYFKFSYKKGVLDTNIAILHYWGFDKPWHHDGRRLNIRSPCANDHAYMLWWDVYKPEYRKFRLLYYISDTIVRKLSKLLKRSK
jgi:lipopolysaccharide biosynthesis glycosyltransferase